jgi:hypothetical protein
MEIVQGKREELYWDKVPEKVRKQAVQKVVNIQSNANAELHMGGGLKVKGEDEPKRTKRKRDR